MHALRRFEGSRMLMQLVCSNGNTELSRNTKGQAASVACRTSRHSVNLLEVHGDGCQNDAATRAYWRGTGAQLRQRLRQGQPLRRPNYIWNPLSRKFLRSSLNLNRASRASVLGLPGAEARRGPDLVDGNDGDRAPAGAAHGFAEYVAVEISVGVRRFLRVGDPH